MSHRLRVPVHDMKEGTWELDPEASRYVAKVHRMKTGQSLVLFDPWLGLEAQAEILSDQLPRLQVEVAEVQEAPRHEMPVTLAVLVAKLDKPEQAMRDATALGAERLALVQGERSVARSESAGRAERLMRVAEQVARQCGRGRIPTLVGPLSLPEFLAQCPADALKLICAFHSEARPLLHFTEAVVKATDGVIVLVGPEGGFSPEELRMCLEAGAQPVDLGPYVLRAEVAVGAVLAGLRAMFVAR